MLSDISTCYPNEICYRVAEGQSSYEGVVFSVELALAGIPNPSR